MNMETKTNEVSAEWESLRENYGDEYLGWFKHTVEKDGYYLDLYRFWLESFDEHISLTPENLHYGIFHHCLDKDKFELVEGRIDITKLRTISLYSEHVNPFQLFGSLSDSLKRKADNESVLQAILDLPKYLNVLKDVISGNMQPEEAEKATEGVLSARIL